MKDKFAVSMFGQKRLSREGGIEIVVKELCTRMARDGCRVTCYNRSGHHVSGAEYDNKIEYDKEQVELCEKICPVNGINYNKRQDKELWGPNYGVYKGWSLDDKIRYEAASGGVITAMACFLVETGKCDAVIQIGPSSDDPYRLF